MKSTEYYKDGTYFEEHGRPDPRDQDLPELPHELDNWDEVSDLSDEELADIAAREGWDGDEVYLVSERRKRHVYEDINSDMDAEQFTWDEYNEAEDLSWHDGDDYSENSGA